MVLRQRPPCVKYCYAITVLTGTDSAIVAFIHEMTLADVPDRVRRRASALLSDLAAVSVGGRPAPAAEIALAYAHAVHPGDEATSLLDGSRLGAVGAALANGVLANVLDYDDGHRMTKGHPGAVIIPATLAVAQLADATPEEFLEAVVVGYEIAIRAGVALHARDDSYHASGAWGGVGAAAAAARLLGLDGEQTLAAFGLAEYHAPIAHIMRSCADPAMTKDACAWGASVGASSALLAARGFTSVRPEFLAHPTDGLGEQWRLEELYIKAYPCCRWSQGAIAAAIAARGDAPLDVSTLRRVRVRTFAAADGLAKVVPQTTEEAQYNLVWPVACALVHGDFTVDDALGPFDDPAIRSVFERITIEIDAELDAAFPARRLTAIELELADGSRRAAGPIEAPGEPEDPGLEQLIAAKVERLIDPERDLAPSPPPSGRPAGLRERDVRELIGLLCTPIEETTHA